MACLVSSTIFSISARMFLLLYSAVRCEPLFNSKSAGDIDTHAAAVKPRGMFIEQIRWDQKRPPEPDVTAWLACGEVLRISSGATCAEASPPPMTVKVVAGPVPGLKASMMAFGSPG